MTMDAADIEKRVRALPCWSDGAALDVQPLSGGLSNLNFVVTDGARKRVVRVGDDQPIHNVMRYNEIASAKAALAVGLTPEIIYTEPGILVIDFIDGQTYGPEDVRKPENLMRILPLVRTLHDEGSHHIFGPCLAFWVFRVHRSYAELLRQGESRMLPQLDRFMSINDELERAVGSVDVCFCHNDLLAANFIDTGDRIWLIDWEHAGYGARLFDLANIASNSELPTDLERIMLETYYGTPADDALWRRFKAFRAGSHLREAMWSMVSEIHLDLDVDYVAYTRDNLEMFEAAYGEFKTL